MSNLQNLFKARYKDEKVTLVDNQNNNQNRSV